MPCNIKNPADIDLSNLEPHIQGMYDYFDQEIGFNKPPTMIFDSDPSNQSNVLGKTAYYDPNTLEIHVYSDGRHPKDMLRSIAHELIHHRQNLEGRLDVGGYHGEGYYLENEELKKLEHEAMLRGNALMREYEDTLKRKENKEMSLNEWKNNELNRLLMKKFGILEENADYKRDDENVEEGLETTGLSGVDGDDKGNTYDDHELKEDSGEEEKEHYEDNKMSDGEHIEAIEKHLQALKKDKDYDEEHEDLEEGRNNPRSTNKDKFAGHEDRYHDDRVHENDAPVPTGEEAESSDEITNSMLEHKVRKVLKKNKKLRLRFK